MNWWITCLVLYFAPPLLTLLIPQHFAMFGRVWLFNLCWIFFWPIILPFLPWNVR